MKKHILTLIAFLTAIVCVSPLMAQHDVENYNIDGLMDDNNITVVYISPMMLKMAPIKSLDIDGSKSMDQLIKSVTSMYVFQADNQDGIELLKKEFAPIMKLKGNGYERLMFVKDGEQRVTFVGKMKGNVSNDLYLLVHDPEEFVVIAFSGDFTRKQFEGISKPNKISDK